MGETGTGLHWRAAAQRSLGDDRSRARIDGELVRVLREKAAAEVTLLRLRDDLVEVQRSVQRAAQKRHVIEQRQAEEATSLERVRTTLEELRAQQAKLETNVALLRRSRADATRTAALIDTGEIATGERPSAVRPAEPVQPVQPVTPVTPAVGASSADAGSAVAADAAASASPRIAPSRTAGVAPAPPAQAALPPDAAATGAERAAEPAASEPPDAADAADTASAAADSGADESSTAESAAPGAPAAESAAGTAAEHTAGTAQEAAAATAPESAAEPDTEPVLAARAPAASELAPAQALATAPVDTAAAVQRAPAPASTRAEATTDADRAAAPSGASPAHPEAGDGTEDPHGPDHPARRRTGFVPVDSFDERTKKERKKADREARRYLQQEQREEKRRAKSRKQQMRAAVKANRSGSAPQPEKLDTATGEEPKAKRGWGAVDLMLAVLIIALLAAGFAIFAWPQMEDVIAGWTSAALLAAPSPLRRSTAGPPPRMRDLNQIMIAAERPAPTRKIRTP